MKHFRAAKNTCQKKKAAFFAQKEEKFVILVLHTDNK
tara:strand:+ start:9 stop:119 length:111 start_codon:yes stop_codon:yes gene_type:complete